MTHGIEDTRMTAWELEEDCEEFECCICEELYPLSDEHAELKLLVKHRNSARTVEKDVCEQCAGMIAMQIK